MQNLSSQRNKFWALIIFVLAAWAFISVAGKEGPVARHAGSPAELITAKADIDLQHGLISGPQPAVLHSDLNRQPEKPGFDPVSRRAPLLVKRLELCAGDYALALLRINLIPRNSDYLPA
ncbi:MAG: hypothetical protein ACOYXB_13030 [Bacteroidota bacterium]